MSTQAVAVPSANLTVMNRIYVGSVMFDISERDVEAVFQTFGPVKNCNMIAEGAAKRHKGYGFIEFETADAAQLAIDQMNGAELGGRPIKAGRPTNYPTEMPPGVPAPNPQRIYVANIHELVQETELRKVFEVFGPIRQCSLIPDPLQSDRHRGYAYIEFEAEVSVEAISSAIQSLNGFELAGRVLRVGRTVVGGPMPVGMGEQQAKRRQEEQSRVPQAVLRAAEQINASLKGPPTSNAATIVLLNMEDYDTLVKNPSMPAELEEDIGEECSKFGQVERVLVHLDHRLHTVRVYVRFAGGIEEAEAAIRVMHHRWFDGRQIVAERCDVDLSKIK